MTGERGDVTLPGLLVAMTLMLIVIGAAFSVFGSADRLQRKSELTQDAQRQARNALDRITMELRNMASPTNDAPLAIAGVTPTDIVFQTVDKTMPTGSANAWNIKRVRYCIDPRGRLWRGEQTWTTAAAPAPPTPAGGDCPGTWPSSKQMTASVVNGARPLFKVNATDVTQITKVDVDLFVRVDTQQGRGDTELASGVFLRNQNRVPAAAIDVVAVNAQGILLSAADSADPEGDTLKYEWTDITSGGNRAIGSGVTVLYPSTGLQKGQSYNIQLKVTDAGGLTNTATRWVTFTY
jgi:type II secretory pathway pseudopilin PulG